MKHPPFDSWLFDSESLAPDEGAALEQHLAGCAECRALSEAWRGVESRMLASKPVDPGPGFVSRWQLRLAQAQAKRRTRRTWAVLAATVSGATILAPIFGLRLWALINAPTEAALQWLERLRSLSAQLETLRSFFTFILRTLQDVPALWLVGLLLAALWVSGLWAGLLYRLAFKTIPNGVSR